MPESSKKSKAWLWILLILLGLVILVLLVLWFTGVFKKGSASAPAPAPAPSPSSPVSPPSPPAPVDSGGTYAPSPPVDSGSTDNPPAQPLYGLSELLAGKVGTIENSLGNCLAVNPDDTEVDMVICQPSDNKQQWSLSQSDKKLRVTWAPSKTRQCLGFHGSESDRGNKLTMGDCGDYEDQKEWIPIQVPGGFKLINGAKQSYCADGAGSIPVRNICSDGEASQVWQFNEVSTPEYSLPPGFNFG